MICDDDIPIVPNTNAWHARVWWGIPTLRYMTKLNYYCMQKEVYYTLTQAQN